ncbi:pyruvate, phosphate dikinase, partial [Alphaproteobacteria bacterium]|nr:pyruvate, phosphate dikinase [Alphaproteobacteria bacterium]
GLPVPAGFTISTELCTHFYDNGKNYPDELTVQVASALTLIEKAVGTKFGSLENPLLLSVRSGARASMPGMMDTVLNLGLNDETVAGLATRSGDERFAYDSYRRFIQMYSDVVLGVDHSLFEDILDDHKEDKEVFLDTELTAEDWKLIVERYKRCVREELDEDFPQDPEQQLWGAIGAVFSSWMNSRAIIYRSLHDIPQSWGTAVNIQAMVFGNMGDDCATGVAFTRDPSTGEAAFYGEYLINAQGEDVVAGIRTPQQLTIHGKETQGSTKLAMEEVMPEAFAELEKVRTTLERHYCDMQDIEFTVQNNQLFMLQTRNGKRTAQAALKIAVDMVEEGLITEEQALMRLDPASLDQLLHPTLDPDAERTVILRGLPASPGAAAGEVVFSSEDAVDRANSGVPVILVRVETSPEDIHGMHASKAILTSRGGMTSHAAVVARGMGTPCICGASDLRIDYQQQLFTVRGQVVKSGDFITLDGATGEVMLGEVPTLNPDLSGDFSQIMVWADKVRTMAVRANAETERDAEMAISFGAEGIGLCRTEHMFFEAERIVAVRQMILAESSEERRAALDKLLPMQRDDFSKLFAVMAGRPITIRLLDPPLHEFLPHSAEEMEEVAAAASVSIDAINARSRELSESNPMLGHRGCRLGITFPEIYEMQARAIFEAVALLKKETGTAVTPEIMIPLVSMPKELSVLVELVRTIADKIKEEHEVEFDYLVGTMIELPRACLLASEIAENAEFFSFGTNDLTQTTYGLSRDDASGFLNDYARRGLIDRDPFQSLDPKGVGELVKIATERGRAQSPNLKLGICGEHGGDPASIDFCQSVGLDYVSCSAFRVPIARLAAAQSALKSNARS